MGLEFEKINPIFTSGLKNLVEKEKYCIDAIETRNNINSY